MEILNIQIKISSPLAIDDNGDQPRIKKDENGTMGLVLSAIARHGKEYNRTWVEKTFGPLDDYSNNPGALLRQVKELMGW